MLHCSEFTQRDRKDPPGLLSRLRPRVRWDSVHPRPMPSSALNVGHLAFRPTTRRVARGISCVSGHCPQLQPPLFKRSAPKTLRRDLSVTVSGDSSAARDLGWGGGGYLIEGFAFNFHILTMWSLLHFYIFSPFSPQPRRRNWAVSKSREW